MINFFFFNKDSIIIFVMSSDCIDYISKKLKKNVEKPGVIVLGGCFNPVHFGHIQALG
jgi:bifunctional ADP-heptose synthase (sugar kinase/adenylyltransferase)